MTLGALWFTGLPIPANPDSALQSSAQGLFVQPPALAYFEGRDFQHRDIRQVVSSDFSPKLKNRRRAEF
jgi:hypothetical protein